MRRRQPDERRRLLLDLPEGGVRLLRQRRGRGRRAVRRRQQDGRRRLRERLHPDPPGRRGGLPDAEPAPERGVRRHRGRRRPAGGGHGAHPEHPLPRRAGPGGRQGDHRPGGVQGRLRRRRDVQGKGGDGDRHHLPAGRHLARPDQHPRPHHLHERPSLHEHRRALRAPPRVAQGPRRAHQDPRPRRRDRRSDLLGRGALPLRRGDVDRGLGQANRPPPQPEQGLRGRAGQAAGRLRHLPAQRLDAPQRLPRRGGVRLDRGHRLRQGRDVHGGERL